MKKSTFILTTIITCFSLTSCNNKNDTKSDLIFSEIIEGSSNNRAVEIYNVSEKELDLTKYKIEIQMVSKIIEINLEGSIKPKETYSIVYSDACEELKNKANLLTEDLKFIGSQPLLLKKGKKTLDVLGLEGYQIEYCKNLTLARKEEYLIGRNTFDEYDWIRYSEDNFKYLGTIKPSVSEIELLEGPKLVDSDYENPFYVTNDKNELIGGGGLIDVTVKSYVDGDTTCFNYPDEILSILNIYQGTKVRYQNIDTPESYEGNVQKFGVKAKEYTKSRLSSALEIKIQSIVGGELKDTYNRVLAWVWIDGELLNNSIVQMGYSDVAFGTIDNMSYKDVTYSNYLYNSELYAKKYEKGIHGEIDPYWDYDNNKPIDNITGVNPNK